MIEVEEKWVKVGIKFYEDRYLVSSFGSVKSLSHINRDNRRKQEKLLKYTLDKRGYPRVQLTKDRKSIHIRIHRLVALSFLPNPNNLPQVNHKDGNKLNNYISNLEWITNLDNIRHAVRTGLMKPRFGVKAARFSRKVLVFNKENVQIDTLFGNLDMKNKGYDFRNVWACLNGLRKSHRGCSFKEVLI